MKNEKLLDAFGQIDEEFVEEADPEKRKTAKKKSKKTLWIKWGAMASCLVVVMIAGVFMVTDNHTVQTSIGGVKREYKNVSVSASEEAIIWPWEYKTLYERFPTIIYNGKEYTTKTFGLAADETLMGAEIGMGEAVGYDSYTEKEYRQNMKIRQIKGISPELMIAAEMDGQFYTFKYNEYEPPVTLGEVLDNYSLSQILALNKFGVYKEGKETGYYSLADDNYIWQVLEECRGAVFVEDEAGGRISRERITFTATSQSLGVYKRAFYVTADGYISTNIFDWAYTFYIGEDKASDIISYANKNAVEIEREPYTYSLAGTLTEIGEGYILVDDSILCVDENDGMVFKVLTSDLRISRCIDYQNISTGSIVVISFSEPLSVDEGNVVSGAISMAKGAIYDGEVAVPE